MRMRVLSYKSSVYILAASLGFSALFVSYIIDGIQTEVYMSWKISGWRIKYHKRIRKHILNVILVFAMCVMIKWTMFMLTDFWLAHRGLKAMDGILQMTLSNGFCWIYIYIFFMYITFCRSSFAVARVVMAWCRQTKMHYLNQCQPSLTTTYAVTRQQWVQSALIQAVAWRWAGHMP